MGERIIQIRLLQRAIRFWGPKKGGVCVLKVGEGVKKKVQKRIVRLYQIFAMVFAIRYTKYKAFFFFYKLTRTRSTDE